MKKNLLATSALVAAGALASQGALAEAKPISIKVGGYHEQWVGFAVIDPPSGDDISDLDVQEDSEIHFKGSTTLDNGLTFGVNVQLEGNVQDDIIDESYLFVRGSFGEIVLGNENGAAYAMHYGFSSHGVSLNTGDHQNWITGNSFDLASTYVFARRDNDSAKIRWISPRFEGFQVGLSYAPEATQDDDGFPTEATNSGVNEEQVFAAAVNYDGKFDDVRIRASLGFQGFGDSNVIGDDEAWAAAAGLRVGFGGFEVHLSAAHQNDRTTGAGLVDRQNIGGALLYTSGPIGVSLAAIYGQDDGDTAAADDEQIAVELGGKYKLGPGVEARGSIYYGNRDNAGAENSGFAVVGGIKLNF